MVFADFDAGAVVWLQGGSPVSDGLWRRANGVGVGVHGLRRVLQFPQSL